MITHLNNVHPRSLHTLAPSVLTGLAAWLCVACARLNVRDGPCLGHACSHLELAERRLRAQQASRGQPLPPLPRRQDTWTEMVRRMEAHRGGPARSLVVEEFHQGLSLGMA